jgi:hypothetical protein
MLPAPAGTPSLVDNVAGCSAFNLAKDQWQGDDAG